MACQENAVTKKHLQYSNVITNIETTYKGAFSVALNSKPDHIYSATYDYLKANYFTGDFQFNPNELESKVNDAARINSAYDLDLSFLTDDQKNIAVPFLNVIINENDLSAAEAATDSFNNDVIQSSLSDEQKYQLLAIGTAIKVGVQIIQDASANSNRISARVDPKSALQAGVLGLAGGAISGCYTGATGGTVVFPGLGTATGCVGGAVLGGAIGFISGVSYSVLQGLLFDLSNNEKKTIL